MDVGLVAVQFLHIAGGAAWFGASLFANLVLIPYIGHQSPGRQRELIGGVILRPERVLIGAALTAAVTGLVRGIGFGRIQSLDAFGTSYGVVWLASVVVAMAVFAIGGRVTSPAARSLRDDDQVWAMGPAAPALFDRLRLGFRLELLGITTILALMVVLARL